MEKARVLLIDDEKELADVMKERLEAAGYAVTACYDGQQALERVSAQDFDVALVDLIIGDTDGITVMHKIKLIKPLTECIVLSGQGTLRLAVEAMKSGAYEFLEKPFEKEKVTEVIDAAFAKKQEQEKRIANAAKRIYAKLENAMVEATFAQAGQGDTKSKGK